MDRVSPLVSVVIPTYNGAKYLPQALDSVLAQTYRPYEIVVVDDGSKDNTRAVLQPYLTQISYVYQDNRGEPAARNTGIRNSKGEFIAFLDADDLWHPRKLELQMNCFRQHPEYGLVYCLMQTFMGEPLPEFDRMEAPPSAVPTGRIFSQLFWKPAFAPSAVLFRKSCIDSAGLFDEHFFIGCDYQMWLRMARHVQIGCVPQPLTLYRLHPGSLSAGLGRALQNGIPWEIKVLQSVFSLYPESERELGRGLIRRRFGKAYFDLAANLLAEGKYKEARKLMRTAVRHWPVNLRYQFWYWATFLKPSHVEAMKKVYRALFKTPRKSLAAASS